MKKQYTGNGLDLKEYLSVERITIDEFINRFDQLSKSTLYDWFETHKFDKAIFARVIKEGKVPVEIFQNITDENPNKNNDSMQKLIETIERAVSTNEKLANEVIDANAFIRNYLKENNLKAKSA